MREASHTHHCALDHARAIARSRPDNKLGYKAITYNKINRHIQREYDGFLFKLCFAWYNKNILIPIFRPKAFLSGGIFNGGIYAL